MEEGSEAEKRTIEENRYKQLYRMTEKFHSSMNKESILKEFIFSLRDVYPNLSYFLFLSQDHKEYENLPIKSLDYNSKNASLMHSYVSGSVAYEDGAESGESFLYVPLKGRQGVYGVLQVSAPNAHEFPRDEVKFISLLATTAGGAIENAQLYEQSKQLILDLQFMNEVSRYLNTVYSLHDMLEYLTNKVLSSFSAEETAFIFISCQDKKAIVQEGSTPFFFTEEAQSIIDYFTERLIAENEALFISDLAEVSQMNTVQYHSAMAVPIQNAGVLKGCAIALHRKPYFFSFETFKLYVSLIQHSSLAFSNILLREELEKLVITDYLTKLHSRNFLDQEIKNSMQEDRCGTFIIIDIDDFKNINDTYGHQVGDEVIIQVADIIRSNIRSTDIAARWGGEELAVYLPRVHPEIGLQVAERLVTKVRESTHPPVTISCGLSFWAYNQCDSYHSLFQRADKALYQAKATGKNKAVVWKDN